MTKQDLYAAVARKTGAEKTATSVIIDAAIDEIVDAIAHGETITIRGLFTIAPKLRKEKVGRIIGRGKSIIIPAHYVPHAKFCKELKNAVKKNMK